MRFRAVGGPTLQQVERQQEQENAPGGDLDPPPIKEGEEDDPDDALPGQWRPRTLWFGLGKRWTWKTTQNDRILSPRITFLLISFLFPLSVPVIFLTARIQFPALMNNWMMRAKVEIRETAIWWHGMSLLQQNDAAQSLISFG